MDQKHREYCIRLGNPYMREERYKEQFEENKQLDSSWIPNTNLEQDDWLKSSKKFTN